MGLTGIFSSVGARNNTRNTAKDQEAKIETAKDQEAKIETTPAKDGNLAGDVAAAPDVTDVLAFTPEDDSDIEVIGSFDEEMMVSVSEKEMTESTPEVEEAKNIALADATHTLNASIKDLKLADGVANEFMTKVLAEKNLDMFVETFLTNVGSLGLEDSVLNKLIEKVMAAVNGITDIDQTETYEAKEVEPPSEDA